MSPEQTRAYNRAYYLANKERIDAYKREWASRPENRKRAKERREKNRDKIREYRKRNAERIRIQGRAWARLNRDKLNARQRTRAARIRHNTYLQRRRDNDPHWRMTHNLRQRIRKALKGISKSAATFDLIGCDYSTFRTYIESLWQLGMTWDNYGYRGWHIDHIKPCASFDLINPEQQRKCFHYSNLQPLWRVDNQRKGAR